MRSPSKKVNMHTEYQVIIKTFTDNNPSSSRDLSIYHLPFNPQSANILHRIQIAIEDILKQEGLL